MIRKMIFATAAIIAATSTASAADVVVEYDSARMGDPAYVEMFYAKLEAASRKACKRELAGSVFYFTTLRVCVEATLAESVEKVGSPMLTAYAEGDPIPQQLASAE